MKKYFYALLFVFAMTSTAFAGQWIDRAAQAYRGGETVYVGTNEGAAASVDASKIRTAIGQSSVPVFFAVLPASAENETTAEEMPLAIGRQLSVPVAVGVLVGSKFRANAVGDVAGLSGSTIAASATRAFQDYRSQGPTGVVVGWAGLLPQLPTTYVATREAVKAGSDGTAFPWWMIAVIAGVGIAICWYYFYSKNKAEEKEYKADMERYRKPIKKAYKGREYDYTRQRSGNCTHYYNGGYHEGNFYPAGYYSDNFWRDWIILDTVLNSRRDSDRDAGVASHVPDHARDYKPTWQDATVEPPAKKEDPQPRKFDSGPGGGDFTPSYTPPADPPKSSYDSSSSLGSGGSSWGSGGGDFGSSSGGGDFGGSSSGGGDFGGGDSGSSGGGDF